MNAHLSLSIIIGKEKGEDLPCVVEEDATRCRVTNQPFGNILWFEMCLVCHGSDWIVCISLNWDGMDGYLWSGPKDPMLLMLRRIVYIERHFWDFGFLGIIISTNDRTGKVEGFKLRTMAYRLQDDDYTRCKMYLNFFSSFNNWIIINRCLI